LYQFVPVFFIDQFYFFKMSVSFFPVYQYIGDQENGKQQEDKCTCQYCNSEFFRLVYNTQNAAV